jgi:hypothetical protein
MPTTTDKKIILNGTRFAWIHEIAAGAITELWRFDNLQSSIFKIPKPGSTSSSGEYIDINCADGTIWRFPKNTRYLSGIDETDITPADSSSDATSKGEITLVTNEAPIGSNSHPAWIKELKAKMSSLFLITIGTGFSYKAQTDATLKKPDGYVHMIGKLNSDLEQSLTNSPLSTSLTFVSYKNSGLLEADLTAEGLFTAINWKLGGSGKDIAGNKPADIISADAQALLAGDIVIVPNIVYS